MMQDKNQSIWIVFTGKTDIAWLKILKPGFRHCYALIHDGYRWFSIDPLASFRDIEIYHHVSSDYDLAGWMKSQGNRIIPVKSQMSPKKAAPVALFSCVEMIKRLIGIHHPLIITPWQLYRFLKSNNLQT